MREINKYYFSQRGLKLDEGIGAKEGRKSEISTLMAVSYDFGILLKDLTVKRLSLKERNIALNMAKYLITEIELFDKFERHKKLPYVRLSRVFKLNKKAVEELSDYILIYTLIFSNPELCYLQQGLFVKEKENAEAKEVVELIDMSSKDEFKGIILQKGKKSSIILTSEGEFLKVKNTEEELEAGDITKAEISRGFARYKKLAGIVAVIMLALTIGGYFLYTKPHSTVVVNTTSKIIYTINKGQRIVEANSQTSKGKTLIETISPVDKKLDKMVIETLKYAVENEMLPKDGIIINISGNNLEYGSLQETQSYVNENNITVYINNNGNEQKL